LVVAPAGPLGQVRGFRVVAAIESSGLVKFHGGLLGVSSRRCTLDIDVINVLMSQSAGNHQNSLWVFICGWLNKFPTSD
jgi:hypothetical protein